MGRVVIFVYAHGCCCVNSYITTKPVDPQVIKDIFLRSEYPFVAFDNVKWAEKVSQIDAISFEQSSKDYLYTLEYDLDTDNFYIGSNDKDVKPNFSLLDLLLFPSIIQGLYPYMIDDDDYEY